MRSRVIIGVPLRSNRNELEVPIEYIFDYVRRSINKMGAEVLALSPVQDLDYIDVRYNDYPPLTEDEKDRVEFWLDRIDGLFIPGGSKFSPYDQYLLERCVERDIPVLAVCLGMQLMSCYKEEVSINKIESSINHSGSLDQQYVHKVKINKDSKLYNIIGKDEIMVNSFHSYCGNPNHIYKSVAYSEDGILEGLEHPTATFNIGVQWHPEKMIDYDEDARAIMKAFIKAAHDKLVAEIDIL